MTKIITLACVAGVLFLTGGCTTSSRRDVATASDATRPTPPYDITRPTSADPRSVVGMWDCEHPAWRNTITIAGNGTFFFDRKEAGHWTIAELQDHVVLVLAWNRWPAETATMIGPDEFRGKVQGGELVMHRVRSRTR